MGEYPTENLMSMHNQIMGPNMNGPGDPLSGNYQRGPPMYQHPTTSVMLPGPNVRAPHIPQQQSVYNQMSSQMPVDMLQQQSKLIANSILCAFGTTKRLSASQLRFCFL